MKKGLFIVVDGGEGSGKSSLLKQVQDLFPDAIFTREPGGSPFSEEIRSLILGDSASMADEKTLFNLFWASRAEHIEKTIRPALEAGKMVISDRFDSTTYAYQIVGKGCTELESLFWELRKVILGDSIPDLYVFLDIDPVIGRERKKKGNASWNHLDLRAAQFYEQVREGFATFGGRVPSLHLDASQPKEIVYEAFVKSVRSALSSKHGESN